MKTAAKVTCNTCRCDTLQLLSALFDLAADSDRPTLVALRGGACKLLLESASASAALLAELKAARRKVRTCHVGAGTRPRRRRDSPGGAGGRGWRLGPVRTRSCADNVLHTRARQPSERQHTRGAAPAAV